MEQTTKPERYSMRGATDSTRAVVSLSGKIPTLLAVTLFSLMVLAVCGGCQRASGEQLTGGPENDRDGRAVARAGDVVAIGGRVADGKGGAVARAGDVVARAGKVVIDERDEDAVSPGARGSAREATLEIRGGQGTGFSGTCTVGTKKKEIGGQVPERFVYELDGRKLECEIRKRSAGAMNIVLDAGDTDYVQQTGSRRVTVRIVYSNQGFSSSIQSSSTSSGSSSQTITSNSSQVISSSSISSR
jgi:hypothetical protein